MVHKALQGAHAVLGQTIDSLVAGHKLTDDEQMARYVRLHRGNPASMAKFVTAHMPAGGNPLACMRDYEAAMEKLLRDNGHIK
jgi:hypothetical protein